MPRQFGQLVNLNLKTKPKNFQANQPTTAYGDKKAQYIPWAKESPHQRQHISLSPTAMKFLSTDKVIESESKILVTDKKHPQETHLLEQGCLATAISLRCRRKSLYHEVLDFMFIK